jgi:hypothetical protein
VTTPTTATAAGGATVGKVAGFALPRDPDVQAAALIVVGAVVGLVVLGRVFR